jgi:hypothetical protein
MVTMRPVDAGPALQPRLSAFVLSSDARPDPGLELQRVDQALGQSYDFPFLTKEGRRGFVAVR